MKTNNAASASGWGKFTGAADAAKWNAAAQALRHVKDGMTVGLGTGSTASLFIGQLGEKAQEENLTLTCVATSKASEQLARTMGLAVVGLDDVKKIDLAVDGADQVDAKKRLIKGYGGALTREKVVEYAADKFIVIADEGKYSKTLDKLVPIEVLPFAQAPVERGLKRLGAKHVLLRTREGAQPFVTDNGLWILHADFGKMKNPDKLEAEINQIPGVLENGLFCHGVAKVVLGSKTGAREF